MTYMKAYLTLFALPLLLLACEAPKIKAVLNEIEVAAAITDTWDQFVAYVAVGDAAGCASLYTEDSISWLGDKRRRGRDEVRALMGDLLSQGEWQVVERRTEDLLVLGDLATEFGLLRYRLVSATDTVTMHMQYVSVFEQQPDGSWLFHRWMASN